MDLFVLARQLLEELFNVYPDKRYWKQLRGLAEERDVIKALFYLKEEGYIEILEHASLIGQDAIDSVGWAKLKSDGINLIKNPPEFNRIFPSVQQNINISGSEIHGSVLQGIRNVLHSAAEVKEAFDEIVGEVQRSDLPESEKEEVARLLDSIRIEIDTALPDIGEVRTLMESIRTKADWIHERVVKHPVTSSVLANRLIEWLFGLPVE